MNASGWKARAAVAGLLSSGLLLAPGMAERAQACGGFWCSQQAPVNQADEQIIFIDHPDDTVTAIIQIKYVGPSERFAWLIPIAGKPEVAVSSNIAFQRLEPATAPNYSLLRSVQGVCKQVFQTPTAFPASGASFGNNAPRNAEAASPSPIGIVSQGSVGPYDYTTISVDPSLKNPADAAIEWFGKEGYDLSGVDAQVLGPYLAEGLNLLAFKLTKGAGAQTGSIRPVMLTYKSSRPMIPIRPTAVAAQNDMGVLVWVVGASQAVPDNYKSLVLNEAMINWFSWRSTYDQVVTAAADEASGQGFVTEFAGKTEGMAPSVYTTMDEQQWQQISSNAYPADGRMAVQQASFIYRSYDGWVEAIEHSVTLPAGVTAAQFGAQPTGYPGVQVDVQRFFTELHDRVVEPLAETQRLLTSQPYMTRLYSTMSAEEMTVDPAFTFNADLADVDRAHVAKQTVLCNPNVTEFDAPWRVELPHGGAVVGRGTSWPLALNSMPVNLKVVQLGATGAGKVVQDNTEQIAGALYARSNALTAPSQMPPATGMVIGGTQIVTMSDAARARAKASRDCATVSPGAAPNAGQLLVFLLGLPFLLHRAHRRTAR